MSDKKKSFIIHIDSLDVIDDLTDEQAGKLLKAIKSYHKDDEIVLDSITKIAFAPFKSQFARDHEKWENVRTARASAGSKGGKQKVANASKSKQKVANLAVSVNGSVSGSDSVSDKKESKKEKIPYQLIADAYNDFANTTGNPELVKLTDARKRSIRKLWSFDSDNDTESKRTNHHEYWLRYFDHCKYITFLNNTIEKKGDHANWRPDFDFMMKEKTYIGIREGKYS